jgi:hypothetical protein
MSKFDDFYDWKKYWDSPKIDQLHSKINDTHLKCDYIKLNAINNLIENKTENISIWERITNRISDLINDTYYKANWFFWTFLHMIIISLIFLWLIQPDVLNYFNVHIESPVYRNLALFLTFLTSIIIIQIIFMSI